MVGASCFMLRQKLHRYIYIHGRDCQVFDLAVDPAERENLAGRPDDREIEARMRARILELFDPDAIAADVARSVSQRLLIDRAMRINQTTWHHHRCSIRTRSRSNATCASVTVEQWCDLQVGTLMVASPCGRHMAEANTAQPDVRRARNPDAS